MTALPYRTFMEEVRNRLAQKSRDELKELLLQWAADQPAANRSTFFAHLTIRQKEKLSRKELTSLINTAKAFTTRVTEGCYCDGWGWDEAICEERSWGDESWVAEAEVLFGAAREILDAGYHREAAEVYRMLFESIDQGTDSGNLPGQDCPYDMLDLDLDEIVSLYLRAIYLEARPADRPAKLLAEMNGFRYFCPAVSLDRIINALEGELPDLQLFLSPWIEQLQNSTSCHKSTLLREAITLQGGTAAIARFARENAAKHPYAFLDWIEELKKKGDPAPVLAAAREALKMIPEDYRARAKAAEEICRIGKKANDNTLLLDGCWESFSSNPSAKSLLTLYRGAIDCGCLEPVRARIETRTRQLIEEHGTEVQGSLSKELERAHISKNLLTLIMILNGEQEKLLERCKGEGSLGWTYGDNPKFLVVIYLLELLSQNGRYKTIINRQWENAFAAANGSNIRNGELFEQFMAVLNLVKGEIVPSKVQHKYYLDWCKREIGKRVDAIVSNRYRHSYYKAAELIAAMSETLANMNRLNESSAFPEFYRARYPRHSAFKTELSRAFKEANLN